MISSPAGGSVTAQSTTANVASITYALTKDEYDTWSASASTSPLYNGDETVYLTANTSINDPFFQIFYCGGSQDHNYTCYKYQPLVSSDGAPRFDTDTVGAKALYHAVGGAVQEEAITTFTGAKFGISVVSSALLAAGVLAVSAF